MKTPTHYMIISSYNMDSIPSEREALGHVVFSNIINFIYSLLLLFMM